MDEADKIKEHVKKTCQLIIKFCDGALMCTEHGKPLYEFASNMQSEMRRLESEVHNIVDYD